MNNQVSKLLNVDFPKPNHSNFNLGRKNVISADVGYLYPVYVEEVLANSYKRLDVEALVQCNATVAPVMSGFTTKLEAFFIPTRIYHQHLLNNDRANNYDDDFPLHYFPWLHYNDTYTLKGGSTTNIGRVRLYNDCGSLLDYLGMFPSGWNSLSWTNTGTSINITAYPFIGYFDIFRNYYANPYDEQIPFRVDNDAFSYVSFSAQARADGNVNLKQFDTFVNRVRAQSLNAAGSPTAVNVFNLFNDVMTYSRAVTSGDNSTQFYTTSVPLFSNGNVDYYSNNGLHFGLLRRTYKDDYFNARISSDFVQYLKEQSRVKVNDSGEFDITQLRLANRIAKYVDKLGFSDSRFGTWLKVHFGTRLNDRMDIPQFLGSISSTVAFDDIISNAQTGESDVITSNEALGSRAGLGSGYIKNKGSFFEFKAVEPGYIIVLFSLVPNVTYSQGIKKMYLRQRFSDIYTPEYDAIGYQDLHTVELSAVGYAVDRSTISSSAINGPLQFGDYNKVVGKQPSWLEYMTSIDESHGLVQDFTQYGYWTLNRPFDLNAYFGKGNDREPALNYTTYIQPELFNNIFAVNKLTDNFQVQFRFYDRTSQPMSKQVLPRL